MCVLVGWLFNIFILVGKTTLADSLVASNGIISQRQAGKVSLHRGWLQVEWGVQENLWGF